MSIDPISFVSCAYLGIGCWFAGFAVGSLYEQGRSDKLPGAWLLSLVIGALWPLVLFIGFKMNRKEKK